MAVEMRIIAGSYRGTALTPVGKGDANAHLRPTSDRVRESLFSILASRVDMTGAHVLDLFAGTGALGLEALSRGAAQLCFVDNGRAAYKLLSKNIAKLRAAEQCNIMTCDATKLPANPYPPFDLIFLDPPYGKDLGVTALEAAATNGWLAEDALIVWEEDAPQTPPDGFEQIDTRRYGDTHVTLLTVRPEPRP